MGTLTTILAKVVKLLGIVGTVLDVVVDLLGRIVAIFSWEKGEYILDWLDNNRIEYWIDTVAEWLKKFKS